MTRTVIYAGFGAALLLAGCASTKKKVQDENAQPALPPKEEQKEEKAVSTLPERSPVERPYDKTLKLEGVTFRVQCPNKDSLNSLTITPQGLEGEPPPIQVEADGVVVGSEVADLDADGSPEIYVYVTSAGSGSYGTLVAYACNNKKSLTPIYMPDLNDNESAFEGYMGHDEFAVVEGVLARRFPVYLDGDSNANPTGGTRQLQYKLMAGEAGWKLILARVVNS